MQIKSSLSYKHITETATFITMNHIVHIYYCHHLSNLGYLWSFSLSLFSLYPYNSSDPWSFILSLSFLRMVIFRQSLFLSGTDIFQICPKDIRLSVKFGLSGESLLSDRTRKNREEMHSIGQLFPFLFIRIIRQIRGLLSYPHLMFPPTCIVQSVFHSHLFRQFG